MHLHSNGRLLVEWWVLSVTLRIFLSAILSLSLMKNNNNLESELNISNYNCDIFDHICHGQSSTFSSKSTLYISKNTKKEKFIFCDDFRLLKTIFKFKIPTISSSVQYKLYDMIYSITLSPRSKDFGSVH